MEEEKKEDKAAPTRRRRATRRLSGKYKQDDSKKANMRALQSKRAKTPPGSILSSLFRSGVQLLLFLLALSFAVVYVLRCIHDDYFVTIIERARRRDEDLFDEFTYYERPCSVLDVTATQEQGDLLLLKNKETAVDQMMTHGALMIPEILSGAMVQELRDFVVQKNNAVRGTADEYPVSQGLNRISYGIEAAEHPAVIRALKEIHDNSVLQGTLETLMGRNPALTEITAITASYGAPDQAWHSDVKSEGNAVQFGRTYSHSYSLFITLQNTTGAMGATDLCPGTHYCADENLHTICESQKIGLHQTRKDANVWRAGDAALLNQQVWHRGTKHVDQNAIERIIFIVSFIGRPVDPRQLARGTYFHMKWNMWGHTWQDLADSASSMISPFNILRCLHLWKPKNREWGYDLVTSAAMRIGNNQPGCEPEELQGFLDVLDRLGFPAWLDGTIDMESPEAWETYFRETFANYFNFLLKANGVAVSLYFFLTVMVALWSRSTLGIIRDTTRIAWAYGFVLVAAWYTLQTVKTSSWAIGLSSGKTLMRPFPPVEQMSKEDPTVSKGPTTVPHRSDVLVGTRLHTRKIGAYSSWMDYHPGNREFLQYVSHYGGKIFRSYEQGLPSIFSERLIENAVNVIASRHGRFLQQDYRTGDWRLMTGAERQDHVRLKLFIGEKTCSAAIKEEIDFLLDDCRFGYHVRGTSISQISQTHLQDLEEMLFARVPTSPSEALPSKLKSPFAPKFRLPTKTTLAQDNKETWTSWNEYSLSLPEEDYPFFQPLEEVYFITKNGGLASGTVVSISEDGVCEVAVYGEMAGRDPIPRLPCGSFRKRDHLVEGMRAQADYERHGEWFWGHLSRIRPNYDVDMVYDDGDVETGVYRDYYATVWE